MKSLLKGHPYPNEWFARVAESEGITIEEVRNRVNKAQEFDPWKNINAGGHPFWTYKVVDGKIEVGVQPRESVGLAMKLLTGTPPGIICYKVLFDDEQP